MSRDGEARLDAADGGAAPAEPNEGRAEPPHGTSVAVWQVPSPVVGSAFAVRVGVQCSARCSLAGRRVAVLDDSGGLLGEATLTAEARPGSDGLFEAELRLEAPGEPGVCFAGVRFEGHGLAHPHEPSEVRFSYRALAPPDCSVTVRVVSDALEGPLEGIDVRVGPYRAETDARGIARLEVCTGAHELSAWRGDLEPVALRIDVTGDADLTLAAAPRRRRDADEARAWM